MGRITVTTHGVYKLLDGIKLHKATGPNGIPGRLLKELAAIWPLSSLHCTELHLTKAGFNPTGKWHLLCQFSKKATGILPRTTHLLLEQVLTANNLASNLHEQLSWNFHTEVTAKKANRTRAFIARNIHSCPKEVKAASYTTLVRPMMEYATTAWAPHTVQNCHKLKQVQRHAARFACHRYEKTASVTAMMNDLK